MCQLTSQTCNKKCLSTKNTLKGLFVVLIKLNKINNAIKIDGFTFENEEMKTAIIINIVILQMQ